jgi:membrane-bound lytic murein transglycosylase D
MAAGNEASLARVRERTAHRLIHYTVRAGDTVDLIADRYDVTPYQIRRWNALKSSKLVPGRPLRLYVAGPVTTAHTRRSRTSTTARTRRPAARTTTAQKKPATTANSTAPAATLTVH